MLRSEAAAVMGVRLGNLLTQAGMTAVDSTGNMKEPLDDALRGLGYEETEVPTANHDDVSGLLTVTRYYTLRAILERISTSFDLTDEGSAFRLSQVVDQTRKLMNEAWSDAESYIAGGGDPIFDLDLNFLTPRYPATEWG